MTEKEKLEMIQRHICPEVEVFVDCYQKLEENGDTRLVLECFLLHARNLYDFFTQSIEAKADRQRRYGSDADDVIAAEFTTNSESIRVTLADETKKRINKQLHHISWSRLSNENLFGKRQEIYEAIIDGIQSYNSQVAEKYRLTP